MNPKTSNTVRKKQEQHRRRIIPELEIKNKVGKLRLTSQAVTLFDYNINDESTRLYKFVDSEKNRFRIWVFSGRIKLETPLVTSLCFSINIPDKVCLANIFLEEINGIGKIFINDSKDSKIQLCVELLKNDLKSLNFDNTEGLIVYRNSLQMILKNNRQLTSEIEICRRIKSIIELNYPEETRNVDYTDLPIGLRQLLVVFGSWAISDDFERNDIIKKMTKKERMDLLKKIEPKMDKINSYLGTFGKKPLTEAAIKLQCLTELAVELKV